MPPTAFTVQIEVQGTPLGGSGGHWRLSHSASRADTTLMPGHTRLALGTHGSYMDTVRGAGALLALQVGDLGHHMVTLVTCWVG